MSRYRNFETYYKKVFLRKTVNFLKPPIIDARTFQLPLNSTVYIFKVSDILYKLDKSNVCLTNIDGRTLVKNIIDYSNPEPLGEPKRNSHTEIDIANNMIKVEKKFKFLRPDTTKLQLMDKDVLVINTGSLNYANRYMNHSLNDYYKWYNNLETVITKIKENIVSSDKNIFINIDLPLNLPSIQDMNKSSKMHMNSSILSIFSDYRYLTVLELWKWFDTTNTTLFNKFTPEEMKRVNLILNYESKITLLNLGYLYNLNSEHDTKDNSFYKAGNKENRTGLRNSFYLLVNKIYNSYGADFNSIDNSNESEDVLLSNFKDGGELVIKTDNQIDKAIEEDVIVPDDKLILDNIKNELNKVEIDKTLDQSEELSNTLPEVLSTEHNYTDKVIGDIDTLFTNKLLTKSQYNTYNDKLSKLLAKKSPFGDGVTIGEMLDESKDNFDIEDEDIKENVFKVEKAYLKNTVKAMNKSYINKQYRKDLIRTLISMQNNRMLIEDISFDKKEDILGGVETLTIVASPLNGRSSTSRIILPTVYEDGTIRLSGNNYTVRPQKSDVPIRKIDYNNVALSSNYGKLFVTKASYAKDDLGAYIKKQLVLKYQTDDNFRDLVTIGCNNMDGDLPIEYSLISRYIKSFRLNGSFYFFELKNRNKIIKDLSLKQLEVLEKGGYTLVGVSKNNNPMVIDKKGIVYVKKDSTLSAMGNLIDLLDINMDKSPIEFVSLRIYKKHFPVVLLLGYYLGLKNLLKMLKVSYTISKEKNIRITPNQYKLKFRDCTLVVDKNPDYDSIIYGLDNISSGIIKVNFESLNKKSTYEVLFNAVMSAGETTLYVNEIKNLEYLYIDPMTKRVLKYLNQPTTFTGILFKCCEILKDDNYTNPQSADGIQPKGYERLAGMVYNELTTAIKDFNNKSNFSKPKLTINPYSILSRINEDSTTVLVDDLNPIVSIKQVEDLNSLGYGGRSKDSMNAATRELHQSELGLVSEATKDSGDVGISVYLTASPKIGNNFGMLKDMTVNEETGWSQLLSTSAILAPFAVNEDVKRNNFISVQNSHTIAMANMRVPYVRTGYDDIIAIKSPDKYVTKAIKDGEVIKVTKDMIEVKYKDDTNTTKYKIYEWTTKEESGSCYTHTLVPNFDVGDKFSKDDSLLYDDKFFEPDIFNLKRVIYKSGSYVMTSLLEVNETWEDSAAISNKMSSHLATTITKVKSTVIKNDDIILNVKKAKDSVEPSDVLFTIMDSNAAMFGNLDTKALEILQNIKSVSPKAKDRGIVNKVVVYYNCEINTMSDSLKALVAESDKNLIASVGYPGRVNSSYSIEGIPLKEGEVEIKMYLQVGDSMGIGDKAILANQLKFTVGAVYDHDVYTLGGKEVEVMFSNKSLAARIVNSPFLIGTTSTVLDLLKDKAVDMYFN